MYVFRITLELDLAKTTFWKSVEYGGSVNIEKKCIAHAFDQYDFF